MKKFCVLGSLNMDLVTRVDQFPRPGETITGQSFQIFPGGKGANQAAALAKLGARVDLVGARGDDVLGSQYGLLLKKAGIGADGVALLSGFATGTATILVNGQGENQILVVPGANAQVLPSLVEKNRSRFTSASTLLLQLEIPLESVILGARITKEAGGTVILDPAPARPLPEDVYHWIDLLTPNETEAAILTGIDTKDETGIRQAAAILLQRGAGRVIVKAGARGAYLAGPEGFFRVPGFPVDVVDTVAAGDSFNAGLAYALGEGKALLEALRFANAVAGLATTKEGAQSAMPTLAEANRLMDRFPNA